MIEAIEPRQRALMRLAPTPRGEYQQIIIANPDQAVFVFACAQPAPRLGMLDRFLVIAEKQNIPALIVAKEYPETYFFISSSRIFEDNVIGLNADSSQPFYLMGVIAAKMGQGAGVVGGMESRRFRKRSRGSSMGRRVWTRTFR